MAPKDTTPPDDPDFEANADAEDSATTERSEPQDSSGRDPSATKDDETDLLSDDLASASADEKAYRAEDSESSSENGEQEAGAAEHHIGSATTKRPVSERAEAASTDPLSRPTWDHAAVLACLGAVVIVAIAALALTSFAPSRRPSLVLILPALGGVLLAVIGVLGLRGSQASPPPTIVGNRSWLGRLGAALAPYDTWIVFFLALAYLIPGAASFMLIDPWEGHYGEVARRMLEDGDLVHTRWQNEVFRSKPVLAFWLMAGSMDTLGVASGGGYSGELASSDLSMFALRLPFIVFGAIGIAAIYWMLARLVNRRVAAFSALITASTSFYLLVARQAITDMPMVVAVMVAIACFAMTVERGRERLGAISPSNPLRFLRKISALHIFVVVFAVFVGAQAIYYGAYFTTKPLARGLNIPAANAMIAGWIAIWLIGVVTTMFVGFKVTRRGQVWMFWFYAAVGIAILAKGPPGLGLVGVVCLFFLVLTGRWSLLKRFEIPRGIVITTLVAVPWHVAMWLADGPAWFNEYFNHHMLGRFGKGVHGERGTFSFFIEQLGIGMWPWVALVPAALATVLLTPGATRGLRGSRGRENRVRIIVGIWAIAAMATFSISQTKFHHYILPAVPALTILLAFLFDDLWTGKIKRVGAIAVSGAALVLLVCRDLLGEQEKIIELFIYRYDRPWPLGDPWNVDLTDPILYFGIASAVLILALAFSRTRRAVVCALFVVMLAWGLWVGNEYMGAAAPHWGQRALHQKYYAERQIHGIDIKYYGLAELRDDWKNTSSISIESVIPKGFALGQPQTVNLEILNLGLPNNTLRVPGTVSSIGENRFTIELDIQSREFQTLTGFVDAGEFAKKGHRPWRQVNADRLITWQLNWRGENFWSAGEIFGATEDTKTVFVPTDNKAFNKYIKAPERSGRTFYVITERNRARGMKGILPTKRGKESFEIIDESSNKFTLMRFSL